MRNKKRRCPRVDVRQYLGCWVSLHPETHRIVADGASLKEAREAAIRQGIERPLLMLVPKSQAFFAGLSQGSHPVEKSL